MKHLTGKLILSFVSILFTLLLLEMAFRTLDWRGFHENRTRDWEHAILNESERLPGLSFQFRPNSDFALNYDSNPRGYFDENNGLVYHINNYGFRGPDFYPEKAEESFRIMVLGDSVTFGEGVKWEDTFTYRLQESLRRDISPNIEVLNFGVSSWSTTDEISYLEQQGQVFQPDLVLLAYILNDANYTGGLDIWEDFRASYEATGPLRYSYLFSYFYASIGQQIYGRKYVAQTLQDALSHTEDWERSMHFLYKGSVIADNMGAEYAVLIFPFMYQLDDAYPFLPIHDMIREVCQENHIPVLDLLPAYSGYQDTSLWAHPSDQHPNEIGHAIAAEAIADFLINQELLVERP